MKTMEEIAVKMEQPINEAAIYEEAINNLIKAKEEGLPIEEGLFGALFGGVAGATVGPAVMKAVCKVLGIDEKGTMGNLMTSRMVLGALGGILGWKI